MAKIKKNQYELPTPADIGAVPTSRTVGSGTGLSGGGDLTTNRTLSVVYGTAASTATEGNDARLSNSRTPSGAAGGSLAGTYPNPIIAAGAIGSPEIAATVKDPVAGTAGLRTLGTGAQQAVAGNDVRLSDARTPTAHATSHATGGSDVLTPGAIGAATSGHTHDLSAYALAADLAARALDSAVVHNTGNESIGGQKTVGSGTGNQWIFNQPPQIAVGTAANHAVRRDDVRVTADQAANQASVRTLGTGALQAAPGTAPAAAVTDHEASGDPHPQYLTASEGAAAYQPLDPDLTAIAGLAPSDGTVIRRTAGTWGAVALGSSDVLSTIRTVTAATTLVDTDDVLLGDTTSTAFTVTLPTAVGRTGRHYLIKKTGVNALTIATTSSQTIDGLTSELISVMGGFREVVSDGANWRVVGGRIDPIIASFADVAAAGNLALNASQANIYRGRLTGSTATLVAPTQPIDGDVINIEAFATVACSLTINSAILLTGGISATIAIPANKLWSGALRYRGATSPTTSAAAWRLLASSVDV